MLNTSLERILFLDIETVPQCPNYDDLSPEMAQLWDEKSKALQKRTPDRYPSEWTPKDTFANGAGIYAEFGKIVCISVGVVYHDENNDRCIRTKSFVGDDEREILKEFSLLLDKKNYVICGHNIKEFDIPYICRRMLLNGLPLPPTLRIAGKKPWEVSFLDTLELWRFGDYKNYTSLKILTTIFGIPSPKDDIDGSQVATVYYEEKNVKRIAIYCEKDVLATAQLLLRFRGENLIEEKNITFNC